MSGDLFLPDEWLPDPNEPVLLSREMAEALSALVRASGAQVLAGCCTDELRRALAKVREVTS